MINNYPWQINPHIDPQLNYSYDLPNILAQGLFTPTLLQIDNPRILVTGTTSWLARHILHILTENMAFAEIVTIDTKACPQFLRMKRYRQVHYRSIPIKTEIIEPFLVSFNPHIIFHCDYVWNVYEENFINVFETNVCQVEILCKAAVRAQTQRMIMFSDAMVYGPGSEIATEETSLNPHLDLGKSFLEAECIAQMYHRAEGIEILHLRIPSLYGALVPNGIMLLAYLMAEGLLIAPPESADRQIATLSGRDLAVASLLLAIAPYPTHRIFNILEGNVPLKIVLNTLSALLPRNKFMGIATRLATIMKIGYQEDITFPNSVLKFIGSFSRQTTDFFNQLRFENKSPLLTETVVNYLFGLRALSGKRIRDVLGWQPASPLTFLKPSIEQVNNGGWHSFACSIKKRDHSSYSSITTLIDGVMEIVEAVQLYTCDQEVTMAMPLFNFHVDSKSLWLLREAIWKQFLLSFLKTDASQKITSQWPNWIFTIGENILLLIRYECNRAKNLFPDDVSQQIKWLSQQIGSLDRNKLRFYFTTVFLSHLLQCIKAFCSKYQALLELLPEKSYGLFLADDRGDIGIVLQKRGDDVKILFPRSQIETISRAGYFHKRLREFKKVARLHIAVGARLEQFFSDILTNATLKDIVRKFGKDYLVSEDISYYQMIGRTLRESQKNLYLFLDRHNRVAFGIKWNQGLEMLSSSTIDRINVLLEQVQNQETVEKMLCNASCGGNNVAFLQIATVKRLLAEFIAPSRIRKVILSILQHTTNITNKRENSD